MVYFCLVDRLQDILKGSRSYQATPPPPTGAEAAWVAAMRDRLRNHDQAVLKECGGLLREYEDELLQISDFTEFLDVAGVLGDVLAKESSAEAFVERARSAE